MKKKSLIKLGISLVLIVAVSIIALSGFQIGKYIYMPVAEAIQRDLDLGGGTSMLFRVESGDTADNDQQLAESMRILEDRITSLYPSASFSVVGDDMVRVETMNRSSATYISNLATTKGHIAFVADSGEELVTGEDIDHVEIDHTDSGYYYLIVVLKEEAAVDYAAYTMEKGSGTVSIQLDGSTTATFSYYTPVTDGRILVSFQTTSSVESYNSAAEIYTEIGLGELPLAVSTVTNGSVSALTGSNTARNIAIAGIIALAAAVILLIVRFRMNGVIAAVSFYVFALICLFAMGITGMTLTLPGVAGLLIGSVGTFCTMVFAMQKCADELKSGRTRLNAVQFGMKAARGFSIDIFAVFALLAMLTMYFGSTDALRFGQALLVCAVGGAVSSGLILGFLLRNFVRQSAANSPASV